MIESIDESLCPLCSGENRCGQRESSTKDKPCWCMREEIPRAAIEAIDPEHRGKACICRACARRYQRPDQVADSESRRDSSTVSDSVVQSVTPSARPLN